METLPTLRELQSEVDKATVDAIAQGAPNAIWQREVAFWGKKEEAAQRSIQTRLGWLDAPSNFFDHVGEIEAFAKQIQGAGFTHCVLLGMGGSSLCVEVLRDVIGNSERFPRMHVLDSTHPDQVHAIEEAIDLPHTLFIVASKSGTTLEPECFHNYFWEKVKEVRADHPGSQFCAITDPGTALVSLAQQERFVQIFQNPADIGGRYSALSLFGLVPAALMGIDLKKLLERAVEEADLSRLSGESNLPLRLGIALGVAAREGKNKLTLITPPSFRPFGYWVEQLIAESTGKEGKGILPIEGEPLENASIYSKDRLFVNIEVGEEEVTSWEELPGPVVQIHLRDAYDLGAQFFRWEFATAVAGKVLGINPFDEPNVTESKNNTNRVLKENSDLVQPSGNSINDLSSFLSSNVKEGGYIAVMAYLERNEQSIEALSSLRKKLLEKYHVPVTVGFGPRFLHSTGQLHKGGPEGGVYLQLTDTPKHDMPIPNKPFTFGRLVQAQAQGDLESLRSKGRPAMHLYIGNDALQGLNSLPV